MISTREFEGKWSTWAYEGGASTKPSPFPAHGFPLPPEEIEKLAKHFGEHNRDRSEESYDLRLGEFSIRLVYDDQDQTCLLTVAGVGTQQR